MSEQKHTPEPWRVECEEYDCNNDRCQPNAWPTVWAGDIELIGTEGLYSELGREADITNARRIVACVNACAGMSDEAMALAVENGGMKAVIGFARDLERQRDQLLEALRLFVDAERGHGWRDCAPGTVERVAIDQARAAIAAVEASK